MAYAHSRNEQGLRHDLVDHLQAVAALAAQFAADFGASELAHYLGLWHDLGKFHPDFQRYLLEAEAGHYKPSCCPDHKAAGVRVALEQQLGPVALLLQGHHGGLKNKQGLRRWFEKCVNATGDALAPARDVFDFIPASLPTLPAYARPKQTVLATEFFLRFLFSALVDADFLDTERHFSADLGALRGTDVTLAELWERFEHDQRRFNKMPDTLLNRVRREIYGACLEAAPRPPGLFRLTVPTGGGKTRSGMAFALRHACHHGQRRIVVAVPFTTITEQTAQVYREIFRSEDDNRPVVLEDHSGAIGTVEEASRLDPDAAWTRLAAENWDAPIIVTTTVQLFESLFANSARRCRKLHRLARSVIILDEAQSLPPHLLNPILDALQELCAHYGATVVLATATQPAFEAIPVFEKIEAREIISDPECHFKALKRVEYDWCVDTPLAWDQAADLMRREPQVLAILNTKRDALALLDALDDPDALHLSTLLCGAHRFRVIEEVKRRLEAGELCCLLSTQVVEAGVDLDFPLVLRTLGPLDSIIQAAGRANREGKLAKGRVIVFVPAEGELPPGTYQRATQTTQTLLNAGPLDVDDPTTIRRYFARLYQLEETDNKDIQRRRTELDYLEVSRRFRMIDDDTVSVVVAYGSEAEQQSVQSIIAQLRAGTPNARHLLRRLHPYLVSLRRHQAVEYHDQGLIADICPGLGEWLGGYDPVRGLSATEEVQ